MDGSINEHVMNEWSDEWMRECKNGNRWMNKLMNKWTNEWMEESMH